MKLKEGMDCKECGMHVEHPGEYHPYEFCVLKKAGLDPWASAMRVFNSLRERGFPQHVMLSVWVEQEKR